MPQAEQQRGKQRQGGISKQGNPYLRRLLVIGATAVIRHSGGRLAQTPSGAWVNGLLERRPARLASVALANKTARIAWALLAQGVKTYRGIIAGPGRLSRTSHRHNTQHTTHQDCEGEEWH